MRKKINWWAIIALIGLAACGHNEELDVPLRDLSANGWIDFIITILIVFFVVPLMKDE